MWTRRELDTLYRKTRYAVYLRCRALLRDEAEARDVTQEVYLHLLDRPADFRGEASPTTYLFAIATNRCISRLRSKGIRDEGWQDAVANFLRESAEGGDVEGSLSAKQLLSEALKTADEETVSLLVFHFVDGLAQGEIAALLGVSRVTVNQRLQRFLETARHTLGETS